jgi:hypothetical protein
MQTIPIFFIFFNELRYISSAVSYIRLSTLSLDNGMSFIVLAAFWPNTSLQATIKEGLMSSSPME